MTSYCYSCGRYVPLNSQCMCGPCMTLWISASPADRRRLMHIVHNR